MKVKALACAINTTSVVTSIKYIIGVFLLSFWLRILVFYLIQHRAVMMHHAPPPVMELKDVSHIEWPGIQVINNIGFHGDPSHVCQNTSTHILNLKVNPLLPIKGKLPTLYYSIIPENEDKMT